MNQLNITSSSRQTFQPPYFQSWGLLGVHPSHLQTVLSSLAIPLSRLFLGLARLGFSSPFDLGHSSDRSFRFRLFLLLIVNPNDNKDIVNPRQPSINTFFLGINNKIIMQVDSSEQVPVWDYQEHPGVYLKDNSSNGSKLLKISREERISAEEIMKHHWLKNRKRWSLTRGPGWGSKFLEEEDGALAG